MTYMSSDSSLCSNDSTNNYKNVVTGIVSTGNHVLQKTRMIVGEISFKDIMEEKAQIYYRKFTMGYDKSI